MAELLGAETVVTNKPQKIPRTSARKSNVIPKPHLLEKKGSQSQKSKSPALEADVGYKIADPKQLKYLKLRPPTEQPRIPRLAHGLSKVLFQPNVFHRLQDLRSRVYNFAPFLQKVTPMSQFDFNKVSAFVPANRDRILQKMAAKDNALLKSDRKKTRKSIKFYSLTLSMTGILSQLHFVLLGFRNPNMDLLSQHYSQLLPKQQSYLPGATVAAAVVLLKKEGGVWSVDADKLVDKAQLLLELGNLLEVFLVTDEKKYKKYLKQEDPLQEKLIEKVQDAYHYSQISQFLVRLQLDCQDGRLPGTGVFDLKTRAVCAIRHDMDYVQWRGGKHGYQITKQYGGMESYEREKYDLIRLALLKYLFQARMGNMDGIFVCYHNIERIFGFEYLPLADMDNFIHSVPGASGSFGEPERMPQKQDVLYSLANHVASCEFKISFSVLEETLLKVISQACAKNPDCEHIRVVLKAKKASGEEPEGLRVLYSPMTKEQYDMVQNGSSIEADYKLAQELKETNVLEQAAQKHLDGFSNDRNKQIALKLTPLFFKRSWEEKRKLFDALLAATEGAVEGFNVRFQHVFDGKVCTEKQPYPELKSTDWKVRYWFEDMAKEDAKAEYRRGLVAKARMTWLVVVGASAKEMREYGNLGRQRVRFFEKIDRNRAVVVSK